jgi:hypothetical protein
MLPAVLLLLMEAAVLAANWGPAAAYTCLADWLSELFVLGTA